MFKVKLSLSGNPNSTPELLWDTCAVTATVCCRALLCACAPTNLGSRTAKPDKEPGKRENSFFVYIQICRVWRGLWGTTIGDGWGVSARGAVQRVRLARRKFRYGKQARLAFIVCNRFSLPASFCGEGKFLDFFFGFFLYRTVIDFSRLVNCKTNETLVKVTEFNQS